MEKLSLYDLLGLLLPGVIFIFFLNTLSNIYGLTPSWLVNANWTNNIGMSLCFALITGAVLYTSNFHLIEKEIWYSRWYNKLFGMYKPVVNLYLEMEKSLNYMNEELNKKAIKWYKKDIFISKEEYEKLLPDNRDEIKKMHGKFYSRMFSELAYSEKNKHTIAFQSFYFFFRQTALACVLILIMHLIIIGAAIIPCSCIIIPIKTSIEFTVLTLIVLYITVQLAKWYRKRMVFKMYQKYFTHLDKTSNN